MKYCPRCGKKLKDDALFCDKCGYDIVVEEKKDELQVYKTKVASKEYIIDYLKGIKDQERGIYVVPDIDEKILVNACKSTSDNLDPRLILGVIDASFFSRGKGSIVITGDSLYIKDTRIDLVTLVKCSIQTIIENLKNGKTESLDYLFLTFSDGKEMQFNQYECDIPLSLLDNLLNGVIDHVDTFLNYNQIVELTDLDDEVVSQYIKIIINYLKEDDGKIAGADYKNLITFLSRLNLSKEMYTQLRDFIFSKEKNSDFKSQINELCTLLYDKRVSLSAIKQSLFTDLMLCLKDAVQNWEEDEALLEIKEILAINDNQIDFIIRTVNLYKRLMEIRMDDNQVRTHGDKLVSLAKNNSDVALGSLAITNQASCLGLGIKGLGHSSFELYDLEYGVYKGVKSYNLEGHNIRICALMNRLELMDRVQTYMVEDLNYISSHLQSLLSDGEGIAELKDFVLYNSYIAEAMSLAEEDKQLIQKEYWYEYVPHAIDYNEFNELIDKSIDKVLYQQLFDYAYDKEKGYTIREDLDYNDYENIYNMLNAVGYFDTRGTVAQTRSIAKQGFNRIKKGILG